MNRRLASAAIILMLFVPASSLADASADGLGPASTTDSSGASSADGSALQPAGQSSLQSSDATGGQASNGDAGTLQQPATSDNSQLKVLVGNDADGATGGTSGAHSAWFYALWISLGVILVAGGLLVWRRSHRRPSDYVNPFAPLIASELLTSAEAVDDTALDPDAELPAEPGSDDAIAEAETSESVQSDKTPPPAVVDTDNKTGDDSGKPSQRSRKKAHKRHPKRK